MGKNWAGPFFSHLEKWKHQPCADDCLGGEKLGRPILSPPRLVKTSTIPCHEYANNLCFLGGGEKLGRPILSPPRQDKTSTLCRWLSGWRKSGKGHYFPTQTSESINLTLSWIHIESLLIRALTSESINLVQKLGYLCGEKLVRPILSPPWLEKVSTLPCHEYAKTLCFLGGGEKLGWPILSPPRQDKASTLCRWLSGWRKTRLVRYFPTLTSESINLYLSWICKQPLLFRGGEKLGRPILSPPRQDKASTWCRQLSGWRKTWLVSYFPTLTSESTNLTLSWKCKQPLLIRGWGKIGPAHSFPTPTR